MSKRVMFVSRELLSNLVPFSYTQLLRPGVKLSIGGSVDSTRLNENAHKLGLAFTLEN